MANLRVDVMHILIVCRYNPFTCITGTEIFLKNLALELTELGQEVTILCGVSDFNRQTTSRKTNGIDLHEMQPKIPYFEAADVFAECLLHSKRVIKNSRIDVVVNAGAFGVLFNPAMRLFTPHLKPLVVYYAIDSRIAEYARNKLSWKQKGLSTINILKTTALHYFPLIVAEGLSCHLADLVLTSSVDTLNMLRKHCKLPTEKGEVLYFGLPDNFADGFKPQEPITPTFLHIATQGRSERKGTEFFISALKKLRDQHGLRYYGIVVGRRDPYYVVMARRLGVNVMFTGRIPQEELKRYYASCTSLVSPSLTEGFCLPVIEAAAFSKPSIVSDAGSLPELVTNGVDGYVVPVADVDSLAERMHELATDKNLRKHMSEKAMEKAERFKMSSVAENFIHIIRETLNKPR